MNSGMCTFSNRPFSAFSWKRSFLIFRFGIRTYQPTSFRSTLFFRPAAQPMPSSLIGICAPLRLFRSLIQTRVRVPIGHHRRASINLHLHILPGLRPGPHPPSQPLPGPPFCPTHRASRLHPSSRPMYRTAWADSRCTTDSGHRRPPPASRKRAAGWRPQGRLR